MQEPRKYKILKSLYLANIIINILSIILIQFSSKSSFSFEEQAVNIATVSLSIIFYYFLIKAKDIRWIMNIINVLLLISCVFIAKNSEDVFSKIILIAVVLYLLLIIQLYNSKEVVYYLLEMKSKNKNSNIKFIFILLIFFLLIFFKKKIFNLF